MTYVSIYTDLNGRYHTSLTDFVGSPWEAPAFLPGGSALRPARTFAFADALLAVAFYEGISRLPMPWLERLVVYGIPEHAGRYNPLNSLPKPA